MDSRKDALKGLSLSCSRDRTRGDGTYLASRGYGEEVIARTLQKLTSLGYIDDRRFVRQWLRGVGGKQVSPAAAGLVG